MSSPYLSPYENPAIHERISKIIQRHSVNREDVRSATLRGLDLTDCVDVLDLGCGFGFWAQELVHRVAPEATLIGMDACDGNELVYRRSAEEAGRRGRFICTNLVSRLPFDTGSIDLVIAAYSLYFFVHVIPEVARVLRPQGRFLAVTHSERSFAGLLAAADIEQDRSPLMRRIREFSVENGAAQLSRSFERVERVDYHNTLRFGEEDPEDFLEYLRFKVPLLFPGARFQERLTDELIERARQSLRRSGQVLVEKDDALFFCGGSRCP